MNTNKILSILFALFLLVGCDYNDKYFDGYDDEVPTDIKNLEYTLTDADYKAIADNDANKNIAKAKGDSVALSYLTANKYFATPIDEDIYVPAFLASKWFTADNTSAVKLTYNKGVDIPEYVSALNKATIYRVSATDYESVWGEGSTTNFFTPLTSAKANIPNILANAISDAEDGDIVAVDYNESENEPSGAVIAVNEDFNTITASVDIAEIEGWQNVVTAGTLSWGGRTFSGNGFIQASANSATGEMETYMISPIIKTTSGLNLTFEACYGYYKEQGGRLSVLVSSDLSDFTKDGIIAATWDDITSSFLIDIPSGNYGTLTLAGTHNLDNYLGKDIYIAFRYNGDKNAEATTTVQIDNIVVKSESTGSGEDVYVPATGLYAYNGTSWSAYSGNGYMVTNTDYTSMGLSYYSFSGTQADHYLPTFLNLKFPYAQEGDIKAPTYKYFANSATTVRSDEYIFSGTSWEKAASIEVVTSQFVKSEDKWNYDPSTVIVLPPTRTNTQTVLYMQTATDWVWENIDQKELGITVKGKGYVTSYGNNEYYTGCSAYYGNVDMRASAAKAQYPAGYENMTEEQIYNKMVENFIQVMGQVVGILNPDADVVSGIDVFYTVKMGIYTEHTITDVTHQVIYKVIGKGQFEYVEDSFQPL